MNARLRHIAFLAVLAVVVLVAATAPESASAATAAKPAAKQATAKAAKDDKLSASERRAQDSAFEREALDGSAFGSSDGTSSSASAKAEKKSGGGGTLLRALFGFAIVIGAIFGVQWLLKKWAQAKMDGVGGAAGLIDVVATTPLAQGRQLHLVRVADELVLIGSTEHAVSRLGEFDARQLVGELNEDGRATTYALPSATRRALPAAGATPINDFHGMLEGSLASGAALPPAAASAAVEGSFLQRFVHNLKLQTAR